ncbi:cyclin-dependent kinase G1-like [Megalobrama amblycephala]|uniref:cyclin-dependent kinase G1-like n=1 Tax=Megalobrama amblycephala TaxID=75352 RepID=UPI002013D10A|nr:cyclin-dependent kinase G1-like [Megalobrama amblycephala]
MGQRVCKVSPMIGEVCDEHPSTPPKPSINTADQHPHPRDETPVGAGEGNGQERRVIERGGGGGEEGGEEEEETVMKRGGGGGEEGGEEEERKESGRVQEKRKRKKKLWRRLTSFFRAAKKQPPESGSGQGEVNPQQDEGEKRKVAWAGRSSDDYIFSRYSVGDQLGKGGFGVVYEGRRLDDDLKVALKYVMKTKDMKCLLIPDHPNPLPVEIALTILANKGPSAPEIIRLLDWQDHPDHFVMVLECPSPCEDLVQFMRRHGGRLDEEKASQIMRQAAQAANMCCLRGVLHRDIKLSNLLINSETSEVKLIDFGCGDMLRSSPYRSYSGTAVYSPPEYHERGIYYGRQATAWSLGVLMFVMLTGHYPSDYDLLLLKRKLWSKPGLSSECCHLLRALLQDKPSRRLGLGLILYHNWFKVVNLRLAKKQLVFSWDDIAKSYFCFVSGRCIRPLQLVSLVAAWRLVGCDGRRLHPSSRLCVLRGEQALSCVLRLGLREQYLRLAVLLPEGCNGRRFHPSSRLCIFSGRASLELHLAFWLEGAVFASGGTAPGGMCTSFFWVLFSPSWPPTDIPARAPGRASTKGHLVPDIPVCPTSEIPPMATRKVSVMATSCLLQSLKRFLPRFLVMAASELCLSTPSFCSPSNSCHRQFKGSCCCLTVISIPDILNSATLVSRLPVITAWS